MWGCFMSSSKWVIQLKARRAWLLSPGQDGQARQLRGQRGRTWMERGGGGTERPPPRRWEVENGTGIGAAVTRGRRRGSGLLVPTYLL